MFSRSIPWFSPSFAEQHSPADHTHDSIQNCMALFYLFLNCDFWLLNIDVAILSRLRERVYDRFAAPWLCGFRCCDCEIGVALGSLDTSLSKLISSFRAEPFQSCERNKRSGQSSHHDCRSSTARGLQLAEALQEQGQQSDERVIDYEWNQRSRHSQLW